jgi:hypothetical protein
MVRDNNTLCLKVCELLQANNNVEETSMEPTNQQNTKLHLAGEYGNTHEGHILEWNTNPTKITTKN